MPNPNQLNTSNEAAGATQWDNLSQNQESSKAARINFDNLSYEEIKQLQPENLSDEELPILAATLKKRISEYEKIIAAGREKETAQVAEAEATSAPTEDAETDTTEAEETTTNEEATETDPNNADLSGLDTIVADQEPAVSPIAETVPIAPTQTSEEVSETETSEETVTTDAEATPETITAEELEQTRAKAKEKAKKGFSIKNFFSKKVLPVVLAAAVLIGGIVGINAIGKDSSNQPSDENNNQTPTEQVQPTGEQREHHGIYDGYYETGEYMSANKGTPYDFANAAEVASVVGDDECDVMKEVAHNQSESLADQLACIPDTVKAMYGVSSEFMGGKSILETENMIEHLSDEEYDKLIHQVDEIWDAAFTESVTLNGEYQNAFMRTSATGDERVTHENTELVSCTTQENGTAATKFYWTVDGNANSARMGDVTAKIARGADGHIAQGEGVGSCTQIVTEVGTFSFLYKGMSEIPNNPDNPGQPGTPDTPPEPTPPEPEPPVPGHPAKDTEAEIRNAGPRAEQQPLNEDVTPPTTLEQDLAPVEQAHEQVSSGDMAGTPEEVANQQRVDEAAQSASNQSTANAGKTASERAEMFANGDY